uniref:Uncharacterized protein n=1 Tax=Magallana gigas TaxID=29159 RepID=A0A8W8LT38_MAGGI
MAVQKHERHKKQFPMVWPQAVVLVLFCIFQNLGPVTPTSDRDAYFLKETEVIPRNEREYRMLTKDLNCEGNNLNVSYVLHSTEMKTLMVCTPDKNLSGKWCPEFNPDKPYSQNGRVQSKFTAECENMSESPCKGIYSVWESYLFFECFQKFGGISSPLEIPDVIGTAENNTSHSETTAIITDKGKEKEEQYVNVKVRETNNQHPHPDENELRRLTVDLSEDDIYPKVWN